MQVDTLDDSEELSRFREQWKHEVQLRKQGLGPPSQDAQPPRPPDIGNPPISSHAPPSEPPTSKGSGSTARTPRPLADLNADASVATPHTKPRARSSTSAPVEFGPKLRAAVEVYRKAIACEQRSDLDEALRLYMKAFRMDSHVDRAYQLLEGQQQTKHHLSKKHSKGKSTGVDVDLVISPSITTPSLKLPESHGVVTGTLVSIIATWPHDLHFLVDDEKEAVPISILPDEILVHVLCYLDISSLEQFAVVNRKSRIVTLDSSIWRCGLHIWCMFALSYSRNPRDHVQATYKPPQIAEDEDFQTIVENYLGDFRRVFIEQPRVRWDGVYIAICHYMWVNPQKTSQIRFSISSHSNSRNGLSENAWVQVRTFVRV